MEPLNKGWYAVNIGVEKAKNHPFEFSVRETNHREFFPPQDVLMDISVSVVTFSELLFFEILWTWMSQKVSKWLGSVGYNPNKSHL